MSLSDLAPKPPANAYFVMAELLPDWYFKQPPVTKGRVFTVVGDDNIPTTWVISDQMATPLEQRLKAHRSIRTVRVSKYEAPKS